MSLEVKLLAILALVAGIVFGANRLIASHDAGVKAEIVNAYAAQVAAKEQAITASQTEIANESQRMATRARDDALLSVDSHQRLLERFHTALGNGLTTAPRAAGSAASAPGDLPTDVLSRIDEAAGQLAIAADDSYIAGLSCQRKYEALK